VILGNPAFSHVPASEYRLLAHQLGTDQPLPIQYWHWLRHAVEGDLGNSLTTQHSIASTIQQRLPVTLSLVIGSLLLSVPLGVLLGILSAVRGGAVGRALDAFSLAGWVMPIYWLSAELVIIFAVHLRWLPATGYVPLAQSPTEWAKSLVLPVIALSIPSVGFLAQYTREAMVDSLSSTYVLMARAAGIPKASLIWRHAFKTASLQVVTQAGLLVVGLLVGTVFVETVFALPGLGSLIVSAANTHDVPVVQAVTVVFTLVVVGVNLTTDLAYSVLSPKVRPR
jgi:peptide/nickel transport system permease protein